VKKILLAITGLLLLLVIAPPFWFAFFPAEEMRLPDPGKLTSIGEQHRINILDIGSGPTVLMIHGLPGSAYDWRELVTVMQQDGGFRLISIDRSGYGYSDVRPGGDYSVAGNVTDVLRLIDELELDDVTLVGWSYGGVVSMQAAMSGDQRIRRIVLVGSGGPASDDDRPPEASAGMALLYSEPMLYWRAAVPPVSRGLQSVLSDVAFNSGPQPDWWANDLAANFSRFDTVLTYKGEMFADIETEGFVPGSIEVPTLIIHGDRDQLAPVEIGRYLASKIPHAEYVEIVDGSHMLPVTHANQLAEAIREFLQR
jgi:non-heme chloroperoxidase